MTPLFARVLASLAALALLFCAPAAVTQAAVPNYLAYQGYLTDSSGAPINATTSMTFNLWDVGAGGIAPLHSESQSVTVTNGRFNVFLGVNPLLTLPFDTIYYLGVQVEGDPEMTPRQAVVSSPYAIRAATSDALAAGATVGGAQIAGTISAATLPAANVTGNLPVSQGGTGVASAGAAGNVLRSNGAAWASAPLQSADIPDLGGSYIRNTSSAQVASFNIVGNGYVSGGFGVGTTAPTKGRLEIAGTAADGVGLSVAYAYGSAGPGALPPNFSLQSISLYASNNVLAGAYVAFSDERIKRIEGRSDAARDLATLAGIEVTDYTHVDTAAHGSGKHKKVIAQQVERVYPQAVSRTTDVVPDIYQKAPIRDGWVRLATALKKGERVRLIGRRQDGVHEVLDVAPGRFRTGFVTDDAEVFVYGREVKDFRNVDYEAIAMLNVSATQELHRRLEKQAAEIALLKQQLAQMAQLQAQVAALGAATESRPVRWVAAEEVPSTPRRATRHEPGL
ncbi:MAG: tail fiber domain-containing protein [Betaproteobacteria bacterium]|nr:tail fiber domain-containing protein [Betaproteobacteria bacterium]